MTQHSYATSSTSSTGKDQSTALLSCAKSHSALLHLNTTAVQRLVFRMLKLRTSRLQVSTMLADAESP